MKAPSFWYRTQPKWLKILSPFGWPYALATELRQRVAHPYQARIPVICVGNLTVGGTGKTPVVMELVRMIQQLDHNPHILTRGYRGHLRYVAVDAKHTAADVGDEALLLRKVAQTWVGKDRAATAQLAEKAGACCLVMDDGFQNPKLHKDLNIAVIDGSVGFGNRMILPLGPLRETIQGGLKRAQAIVLIGEDKTNIKALLPKKIPVIGADFFLHPADLEVLQGKKIVAFAGLGRPEKFKTSLEQSGLNVVQFTSFGDHHYYSDVELNKLRHLAKSNDAVLVTTEKDFVRLNAAQQNSIMYVRAELKWQKPEQLAQILYPLLDHNIN